MVAKSLPGPLAIGLDNFAPWAANLASAGHVIQRRNGRFELLDLSQPPVSFVNGSGFNRDFLAEMLHENGSTDFALRDMLLTHGAVYLAALEPVLLLQGPLLSFLDSFAGFASTHTEVARMAALQWFDVHVCDRLDLGEFELPCLPFRCNPSGSVARKLEKTRYRGIQDFGAPRRMLRLMPPPDFSFPAELKPVLPRWSGSLGGCIGLVDCALSMVMGALPPTNLTSLGSNPLRDAPFLGTGSKAGTMLRVRIPVLDVPGMEKGENPVLLTGRGAQSHSLVLSSTTDTQLACYLACADGAVGQGSALTRVGRA